MKTDYFVKTSINGDKKELYKVTVPEDTDEREVKEAFEMGATYARDWCQKTIFQKICEKKGMEHSELVKISTEKFPRFLKMGKEVYDEHFETMYELVNESNPMEVIFIYYIIKCKGWKVFAKICCDFELDCSMDRNS